MKPLGIAIVVAMALLTGKGLSHGQGLAGQRVAVRAAADKAFAEGKAVFLHALAPNPLVVSDMGTWKMSVSFIRSKSSQLQVRDLKMSALLVSAAGGTAGTLPGPLKVSAETEGTIEFEVNYRLWMSGGIVDPRPPLALSLIGMDSKEVSNRVDLKLQLK
jgi:hypothetical protein